MLYVPLPAGSASPTSGSARVSVSKAAIDQDSIFFDVEVALQDEPAWQVRHEATMGAVYVLHLHGVSAACCLSQFPGQSGYPAGV
jgi:hypothetical protein